MRENPPAPRCRSDAPCPPHCAVAGARLGAEKRTAKGCCAVSVAGRGAAAANPAEGTTRWKAASGFGTGTHAVGADSGRATLASGRVSEELARAKRPPSFVQRVESNGRDLAGVPATNSSPSDESDDIRSGGGSPKRQSCRQRCRTQLRTHTHEAASNVKRARLETSYCSVDNA